MGLWAMQCGFRAQIKAADTDEWRIRAVCLYKALGIAFKAPIESKDSELCQLYHFDTFENLTLRLLLDKPFLRFLQKLPPLLTLYSTKHLQPSLLSTSINPLLTSTSNIFLEQHAKFLGLYGLHLNHTLIEIDGVLVCAKRVEKKRAWIEDLKELPVPEIKQKKKHLLDTSIDEDMLSKSFLQMNTTIVSQGAGAQFLEEGKEEVLIKDDVIKVEQIQETVNQRA